MGNSASRTDLSLLLALRSRHLVEVERPIYYMVGPPGMVSALRTMLNEAHIDESDIRTVEFTGY